MSEGTIKRETRKVSVRTVCTATVHEEWTFEVPADMELDEVWETFTDGDPVEQMKIRILNVEDTVSDERERDVEEVFESE